MPGMRRLSLLLLCAALIAVEPARAATRAEARGLVVLVQPPRLAIRALDGTRAVFRTNAATVITLNGHRVRLRKLHAGDVVSVQHRGKLATSIRAQRP